MCRRLPLPTKPDVQVRQPPSKATLCISGVLLGIQFRLLQQEDPPLDDSFLAGIKEEITLSCQGFPVGQKVPSLLDVSAECLT